VPPVLASGGPATELTNEGRERFVRGRELFDKDFSLGAGLGPLYNGDSCRACHFEPVIGGAGPAGVDVIRHGMLSADGSFRAPSSGNTIAHRHAVGRTRPAVDSAANVFEHRQTPSLFGAGLIDAIADEAILAHADPADEDRDGIRGRASVLSDGRIGRFGWKAGKATLDDFIVDALANEIGLTAAEISPGDVQAIAFYVSRLAPPPRHSEDRPAEDAGAALFTAMHCASCHAPELATRSGSKVLLYSDLLLHDVAPAGARLVVDDVAGGAFRTAPLWGVSESPPYMHDGKADTLRDAILRHAGEAAESRDAFAAASADAQARLLAFLRSI
jgi:CxxC motif-containing protein (DUF1111 family)